jgi:hypothetical protein
MTASPIYDGTAFASYIVDNGRSQAYLSQLSPDQRALLMLRLADKANAVLESGHPLGLETLIIIAKKPIVF